VLSLSKHPLPEEDGKKKADDEARLHRRYPKNKQIPR
jgi:hypothetical protein